MRYIQYISIIKYPIYPNPLSEVENIVRPRKLATTTTTTFSDKACQFARIVSCLCSPDTRSISSKDGRMPCECIQELNREMG